MTTFQHFVTTWPRKTTCPQCQRTILDGLTEGHPYRIDPIPLTLTAEITAELTGRRTYWTVAGHIFRRTFDNVTTETPVTRPPVYATHTCALPDPHHIAIDYIPDTQQLITDKHLEKATPEQDTDQQALLTIDDVLAGRVTESPDDQDPPF